MSGKQTGEIAVRRSTELAQVDELEQILRGQKEAPTEVIDDPADIAQEIINQLLDAESDEELEAFGSTTGLRTICRRFVEHDGLPIQAGVPFEVGPQGFRWKPSEFQNKGQKVYFILFGTRLDNGEQLTITTGSGSVLAQLVNRAKRGTLVGAQLMATEPEKKTSSGYWPMHLIQVGEKGRSATELTEEHAKAKA